MVLLVNHVVINIVEDGELAGLPVPAAAAAPSGEPEGRAPNDGRGRPKGAQNKITKVIKEAALIAANNVGDPAGISTAEHGLTQYLEYIARRHPVAFCGLLQKILPHQIQGDPEKPLVTKIERVIVRPANSDG